MAKPGRPGQKRGLDTHCTQTYKKKLLASLWPTEPADMPHLPHISFNPFAIKTRTDLKNNFWQKWAGLVHPVTIDVPVTKTFARVSSQKIGHSWPNAYFSNTLIFLVAKPQMQSVSNVMLLVSTYSTVSPLNDLTNHAHVQYNTEE